ncbi:hypothetical protein C8R44DRAFT_992384 [Mycena epipterygia]|nr:hypothetical protein C8R44DRAFT_992384 [Mycena epipterygia]
MERSCRGQRDTAQAFSFKQGPISFTDRLELELYHQIKNVIGVNPTFYDTSHDRKNSSSAAVRHSSRVQALALITIVPVCDRAWIVLGEQSVPSHSGMVYWDPFGSSFLKRRISTLNATPLASTLRRCAWRITDILHRLYAWIPSA